MDDFEFVTETIKKKPINKKRIGLKILFNIAMGVLFGIVACLIFVLVEPKLYAKMYPEKPNLISIPKDEIEENPEEISTDEENVTNVALNTAPEEENAVSETLSEKEETTDSSSGAVVNQIIREKEITLDDYKSLYRQIGTVAAEASRSLALVTAVSNETDWFMNTYETGNQTTGIILADNGKELLIIANSNNISSAKDIDVKFCNGKSYKGTVKKSDSDTGLTVVAVNLEDIDDNTKNSMAMATLGNSSLANLTGTPVMALGSPLGISDSMAMGSITSNKHIFDITDSNLRYITTDIYGSTSGSGVIIDLEGKVLGIIFQGGTSNDTKNLIHAYAISDIKSKIEKLSNGQDLAYLGIKGTDVTDEINEELGVPKGAYVTQVTVDSPAMKEGIQNGDVIIKLGTNEINSFKDYKDAMLKCQPGDLMMVTVKRLSKDGYIELSYEIVLGTKP
ncbi:MAG: PDZ domain-containing protein [Lachnospiraceae bacterium]|nr:PDZ domain-containing protein [Lachnospiraceae bacterium]